VLALAALMNLLAHFVGGNAHVFGMPLNIFMEFVVPALPCVSDRFQVWASSWVSHRPCAFVLRSKAWCALERDSELTHAYLVEEED